MITESSITSINLSSADQDRPHTGPYTEYKVEITNPNGQSQTLRTACLKAFVPKRFVIETDSRQPSNSEARLQIRQNIQESKKDTSNHELVLKLPAQSIDKTLNFSYQDGQIVRKIHNAQDLKSFWQRLPKDATTTEES